MDPYSYTNGVFNKILPRSQPAPCWKSLDKKYSSEAKELQKILDRTVDGNYKLLDQKIDEFMKEGHFFRLTEGNFYEVLPGDYKEVNIKIQVKEGTITWYFTDSNHDETTQEFRNQIFMTATLGHLLVPGACAKYYRGTNSMHVKRMHTSEEESKRNHNHYRVSDNHVTSEQFAKHLNGFLIAQKAYGIGEKFLTSKEAENLILEYTEFDTSLDLKMDGEISLREKYHEMEESKWTELDIDEYIKNKLLEEPCEIKEIAIPLVQTSKREIKILAKNWPLYSFDKEVLDKIAKVGAAGIKSNVAHTRQMENSTLPTLKNAFTKLGELFTKDEYGPAYPQLFVLPAKL